MMLLIVTLVGAGLTLAQGNTQRKLRIGDTVIGTLNAQNFAQVYTFDAVTDNVVTVTATSRTRGLFLALVLTNSVGETLSRAADLTRTEIAVRDFQIPADGTYYITVLRATGAQGSVQGEFSLQLTGRAPASAASVTLAEGMTVALSWNSPDDFNLEVRDPVGGAVNFRTPAVPSGGRLSGNVNGNCQNVVSDAPSENVSWPKGDVPGGSYEIIIYYIQPCAASTSPATQAAGATLEATAAPVTSGTGQGNFTLTVTVDGNALEPVRGTLSPNQQYVTSFILSGPGAVTMQPGGSKLDLDLTPFASRISSPRNFGNSNSVTGSIDRNNPADAWSFQVPAGGRQYTIDMVATSGSLDPLVVLLNENNNIVATNDDAPGRDTRNSEIASQTLSEGRYTIIASRFALQFGGTEGNYTLSISTGSTSSANPTVAPTVAATAGTTDSGGLPSGSIQITLSWNTRADLRLLVRDPNGRSVFSDNRTPADGGILERLGNFRCQTPVTTTPITYAYWPGTTAPAGTYEVSVWEESRCADTAVPPQYTLTVVVNGKDVINLANQRPASNKIHFLTTFTVDGTGNATAGPGGLVPTTFDRNNLTNQLPNAEALTFGVPVSGAISSNSPFVVYTFQGSVGDKLRITMRNSGGNLDPQLFLLDATGNQLQRNDDVKAGEDPNSQIDFNVQTEGSYVVVATRYGIDFGGTTGNYELRIEQLPR
jgi:hypothetical protein